MPLYETVFIARPDLVVDDVDALTEKLAKIVTDGKGKVVSKEYWGLKNLAYKVKKNPRGHYILLNIDADTATVAELNRVISFNEDIIRNITFGVEVHEKQSLLFVSDTAKNYKAGTTINREPNQTDLVLDKVQFEV